MSHFPCKAIGTRLHQYEQPNWQPLLDLVGERLTEGFMWMQEDRLDDGTAIHAYKHIHTRRYLYIAEDGRTFQRSACDGFAWQRQDFAIQAALCTWWLLAGWDQADVDAINEAVERVDCSVSPW